MTRLILLSLIFLSSTHTAYALLACSDPLRNQELCRNMKHLRSQVQMLGAQRDLMQVNYPFLQAISEDMISLTGDLLKDHNQSGILDGLVMIKKKAEKLKIEAKEENPKALVTANLIRKKCASCHATQNPRSGYSWENISKRSWGEIVSFCNSETKNTPANRGASDPRFSAAKRNPYRCKSMHGMLDVVEYFSSSHNSNRAINYKMISQAAGEVERISHDLNSKKMLHGGEFFLKEVNRFAKSVKDLAAQEDPAVAQQRLLLSNNCMRCHSYADGRPGE